MLEGIGGFFGWLGNGLSSDKKERLDEIKQKAREQDDARTPIESRVPRPGADQIQARCDIFTGFRDDWNKAVGQIGVLANVGVQWYGIGASLATPKYVPRFISGVRVTNRRTGETISGTVDLGPTLERIQRGARFPHRNDGSIFRNLPVNGRCLLPTKPNGYYTEFVVPTPGINGPGPQRLVVGQGGEVYYTPDHYQTFIPVSQ